MEELVQTASLRAQCDSVDWGPWDWVQSRGIALVYLSGSGTGALQEAAGLGDQCLSCECFRLSPIVCPDKLAEVRITDVDTKKGYREHWHPLEQQVWADERIRISVFGDHGTVISRDLADCRARAVIGVFVRAAR